MNPHTQMDLRRRSASGFALTEMMVVLCIIGLLLAIGVPATTRFVHSNQLAGATNTLISDMYYARSLATMRRKAYEISFVPGAYTIYQVTPHVTISSRAMPPGIACTATDTATFFPWGLSVPIAVTVKGWSDSTKVQVAVNGSVTHD